MKHSKIYFVMALINIICLSSVYTQVTWQNVTGFGPSNITKGLNGNDIIISYQCLSNTSQEDASSPGIIRTTNNGVNWNRISSGLPSQNIVSVHCNSNGVLLATTHLNGVFRSTNFGLNWGQVNSSRIGLYTSKGDTIFGTDGYWCSGIYRSFNGGVNWTQVNNGVNTCANGITIASNGIVYVATGVNGVYRSTNYGNNWQSSNSGISSTDIITVHVSSIGLIFAGTASSGIYKSTNDGLTWVSVSNGLPSNHISTIVTNSLGHIFIGVNPGGIFRSTNDGLNWVLISNQVVDAIPGITKLLISNSGYLYSITNYIYRSNSPVTVVESISNEIPKKYQLGQNYPNPFNPNTRIDFSLPVDEKVTIKIYNISGEEVAVLADNFYNAGIYSVFWKPESVSSGVYFYKLETENFKETKKMIIVK